MRTRRQTRLLEESSRTEEQHDATPHRANTEEDDTLNSTRDGAPRRKKRASGRASEPRKNKATNRIKGRLSGVLSLPIEVFMEIMRYLALPDVLSLSRSNKFFRQMLLTRSASTLEVWRMAVENVPGLPPCPKDLCEPQYAALIYSKHCSMCGTSVVRPMDPYLNVRLCKDCTEIYVTHVEEVEENIIQRLIHQSTTTRMKASRYGMTTCLIRDVEEFRRWRNGFLRRGGTSDEDLKSELEERFDSIVERIKYAKVMERFLRDMAETRTREIEQLKEQRRQDVKRRLEEAGWEAADWTFPEFVARKWASLVEAPQLLTERAWQKLYPSLVPYLETNRESHREGSRIIRKGKRLRRMRRLLLQIRNHSNLLEVDGEGPLDDENGPDYPSTSVNIPNNAAVSSPSLSDHESDGDTEYDTRNNTEDQNMLIAATSCIKTDTDADTMQEEFEESRDEIEAQIRSWGLAVEKELVSILKAGATDDTHLNGSDDPDQYMDSDSEVPQLQLQTELPPESPFLDRITLNTRLLLRGDSVFRASEDTVAPMPLYFPELFHILQDRPDGFCTYNFRKLNGYERPMHGYTWDPSEVAYYPEGSLAAKALLKELRREDAAQFELQALGTRFTCGSCGDKWPRTWNEMVQHVAEAIAHANAAAKAKASLKKRFNYNNVHKLGLDNKSKGKHKPIVVLHSAEEAKALSSKRRKWESLVRCNLCEQFGIDFRSPRDMMLKHVRTVHSIKAPKAENYGRTSDVRMHTRIDNPMGVVSDSTQATDQEMVKDIVANYANHGMCVFWSYYGPHSNIHPGWGRRDF
ncbi:hypothetical protein OPQ81_000724 [Rhizoctonia solani]|nr:hypothetical protein OPQ81_000724 [Rhizoctonia solani]